METLPSRNGARSNTWQTSVMVGLALTLISLPWIDSWSTEVLGRWFDLNLNILLLGCAIIIFLVISGIVYATTSWWQSRPRFDPDEHWNV